MCRVNNNHCNSEDTERHILEIEQRQALIRRQFAQLAGVATLKVPFIDKNGQLADWKQWDPFLQDIGEFYDH